MKFDEWANNESKLDSRDDPISALREAWNAAIEEAIKVAKEGHTYTPTSTAHNIANRIKELK